MRVAILSLSSCQGCQILFLSLEEYLYTFIGENNVSYAPFLIDEKELQEVDLALVEGTVRNGEQFRRARDMREKADKLVALGTCACYGGVQGLANRISEDELMRRRYGMGTAFEGEPPGVRRLLPLDSYIGIDAYLPGCPPPVDLLKSFLEMALSGDLPSRVSATVCAECKVSSLSPPRTGPHRLTQSMLQAGCWRLPMNPRQCGSTSLRVRGRCPACR